VTIRNDASRPEARLSNRRSARSVIARQGQVLLDIDVDTAGEISAGRAEVEALDTLGQLAAPLAAGGFQIGPGPDATISAGRLYIDGLLVENPTAATLTTQPHRAAALPAGPAIVAIKALVRHIDPIEDRRLTDKALGDAAAAGRGLVDWQVFAVPLAGGATADCAAASTDWDNLILPSSGRLSARVDPGTSSANFCSPAAGGGFTRLENVLYRIEVDGGTPVAGFPTLDGPRFGLSGLRLKMSRRNASLMTRITGYSGRELTVDPPALDSGQWFAAGGVAEIVSVHDDVDPQSAASQVRLFPVAQASDDRVTLAAADPIPLPAPNALGTDWYLRLWDLFPNFALSATAMPAGGATNVEIDCGDGVLVTVWSSTSGPTLFRRGDWWSFTARADGTIDWPMDATSNPLPRVPDGPAIHYARLAAAAGPNAAPVDCRPIFVPLTQQFTLLYRGGDGQLASLTDSAAPFVPLGATARVAVEAGGLPTINRPVRWSIPPGAASGEINGVAGPVTMRTDANGLSEVTWALDRSQPDAEHALVAELVDSPGTPVIPVRFRASFETARRTSYVPGCDLLSRTNNVQDALTTLCLNIGGAAVPDTLQLRGIRLLSGNVELIQEDFILNAIEIDPDRLVEGIVFTCDRGPLAGKPEPFDPIVDVEIELPYPVTTADFDYWMRPLDLTLPFATQRVRLDGQVKVGGNLITWNPTRAAARFLGSARTHLFGEGGKALFAAENVLRILARLRLRSQFIWIETEGKPRIYLNAEHLGVMGPRTGRELDLKRRDPQVAGDLDMFLYLVLKRPS
jgi:hypothetical protein